MSDETGMRWHHDPATDSLKFSGTVSCYDLCNLRLDPLDRAVLAQPAETAADMLLSLEVIFRRLNEKALRREALGDKDGAG